MNIKSLSSVKPEIGKINNKKEQKTLSFVKTEKYKLLPSYAYKSNFLNTVSFKGNGEDSQLRKEVDELKKEVSCLKTEFKEFKEKFEPSETAEIKEYKPESKFKSEKAQIAYDEIVLPLLSSYNLKDEDKSTLDKFKENEKFLKIIQSHPDINGFLKEIRGEEATALNLLKASIGFMMIWEYVLAKPNVLLELNTIGTKYENADIFKSMKKEMDREYYGRNSRFGDDKLSNNWLKKLGNDPSKMNDEEKIERFLNTSGGEKKMLKEETIRLAKENPLAVGKMAKLMDMFFDNYIKTYNIKD
jgi:hypothetical protein